MNTKRFITIWNNGAWKVFDLREYIDVSAHSTKREALAALGKMVARRK